MLSGAGSSPAPPRQQRGRFTAVSGLAPGAPQHRLLCQLTPGEAAGSPWLPSHSDRPLPKSGTLPGPASEPGAGS